MKAIFTMDNGRLEEVEDPPIISIMVLGSGLTSYPSSFLNLYALRGNTSPEYEGSSPLGLRHSSIEFKGFPFLLLRDPNDY